jgi:hypothetical protein
MTRNDFFKKLRHIRTKQTIEIDKKARIKIRASMIEVIKQIKKALLDGANTNEIIETIEKNKPLLAQEWTDAIENSKKEMAQVIAKLEADFIVSQFKQAGANVKPKAAELLAQKIFNKTMQNEYARNEKLKEFRALENAKQKKPIEKVYKAKAWGVGVYTKDEKSGKITFLKRAFTQKFIQQYDLSGEVWKSVDIAQEDILDFLWASQAQGRDTVHTARDLEKFLDNPQRVLGSWGKLEPNVKEYAKRLGKAGVDYRALRIARTETSRAMNDAIKEANKNNPVTTGEFNWVLTPSRHEWNCGCEELAKGSPYKYDNLPDIPAHPNCMCQLTPVLEDWDAFKKKLNEGAYDNWDEDSNLFDWAEK